jgi:xylulokinase
VQAFCGVDIGTTNVKVVVIDGAGAVLSRAAEPTPRRSDGIGPCCDPAEIVALVESLIVRAAALAQLDAPLRAICVAGIGEDGIGVGASGEPLGMAIPWFDDRAHADALCLADVAAPFEGSTGIRIDGARTAAKWRWLARQADVSRQRIVTWIALTDYPAFVWTQRAFMSETLAARTGCYDCAGRHWIPTLLDAAHAPALPPLLAAGSAVGNVLPGPLRDAGVADERTAVIAGGHDHPIAASVVLSIEPRAVLDSMGTAELVYAETTAAPQRSASVTRYLAFSVPVGGGTGTACLGVFPLSAVIAPWLNDDTLCGTELRAVIDGALARGTPGAAGLRFCPLVEQNDGAFSHADADENAARAILEGCAMHTRRTIDALAAAGISLGPIFTTGGWTRSSGLLQLRADVLGAPLRVLDEPQLTALGAALVGARAAGNDATIGARKILQRTVTNDERLVPLYRDVYDVYRADFDRRASRASDHSPFAEMS